MVSRVLWIVLLVLLTITTSTTALAVYEINKLVKDVKELKTSVAAVSEKVKNAKEDLTTLYKKATGDIQHGQLVQTIENKLTTLDAVMAVKGMKERACRCER